MCLRAPKCVSEMAHEGIAWEACATGVAKHGVGLGLAQRAAEADEVGSVAAGAEDLWMERVVRTAEAFGFRGCLGFVVVGVGNDVPAGGSGG